MPSTIASTAEVHRARPIALRPSHRRLIVHADDFGETVDITAGIVAAIVAGRVTSTSILANMPATQSALAKAKALARCASFGVHLNLCEGPALTDAGSLVDERGHFHGKKGLVVRAMAGRLRARDVEREITAQIARVHDAGVRISHIDSHKHLHQLPLVNSVVAQVLPRFGIERIRVTRLDRVRGLFTPSSAIREMFARRALREFRSAGLRSPHRVVDLRTLMRRAVTEEVLQIGAAESVEIFCHPGNNDADRTKPGSCNRYDELNYLLSAQFESVLDRSGARLTTYWEI